MSNDSNEKGGVDHSTHHLLSIHEPPTALVALREELQYHPDIVEYAQQGNSFEECLARIGTMLDIALDGVYDGSEICALFVRVLRNKRFGITELDSQLVPAELVEREGEISLETRPENEQIISGSGAQTSSVGVEPETETQTETKPKPTLIN